MLFHSHIIILRSKLSLLIQISVTRLVLFMQLYYPRGIFCRFFEDGEFHFPYRLNKMIQRWIFVQTLHSRWHEKSVMIVHFCSLTFHFHLWQDLISFIVVKDNKSFQCKILLIKYYKKVCVLEVLITGTWFTHPHRSIMTGALNFKWKNCKKKCPLFLGGGGRGLRRKGPVTLGDN